MVCAVAIIAQQVANSLFLGIEYALRVWVAAEHAPTRHASASKARWKFVSSPLGVIDLLAVLPFWLAFVLPVDLRVLPSDVSAQVLPDSRRAVTSNSRQRTNPFGRARVP